MKNRALFSFIILFLFSLTSVSQAEGASPIKHVDSRPVKAHAFKRISEYFKGEENTGGNIILRSHPETREGYYFIVSLKGAAAQFPANSKVLLHTIENVAPRPTTLSFDLPASPANAKEIWIGLTQDKAPKQRDEIVAWKIEIVDEAGNQLAAKQSFLWSMPQNK